MTPVVHKQFRRFLVIEHGAPIAEGVQFQDEHAASRELAARGRVTSLWDSVGQLLDNVRFAQSSIAWVEDDDTIRIDGRYRRFVVQRDIDETGVSGTGQVVEGVQFEDGRVAYRWCAQPVRSSGVYASADELIEIHGHDGKTRLVWVD